MKIEDLRVVQLSAAYIGAQKQIEDAIHSVLKDNGIPNIVLFCYGTSDNTNYKKCESRLESFIRRFFYKHILKSHIFARHQTKKVIRYLQEFEPNVVHLHTLHHGYIDYPRLFSYLKKKNIKIIYTVHDMWPFTGGCYYYTELNCNQFLSECSKCLASNEKIDCKNNKTHHNYVKKLECYKDQNITFVSVSNWVNQELEKTYLNNYKHCTINNCILAHDTENDENKSFSEQVLKKIGDRKSLVFVAGAWDERKGYDIICDLSGLLGEEYILLIVGNISQSLKAKAGSNMVFMGYVNNDLLRTMYGLCDLHVSASKEETFGMTFVEAAFEGTRSVGFFQTAVGDTITDVGGECSLELTSEGLYKAIIKTINRPKLSSEEVKEIKQRYSEESMARKYLQLYLED